MLHCPRASCRKLLADSCDRSFNSITVDGDTSTSDTLLLCATGKAGNEAKGLRSIDDAKLKSFRKALDEVLQDLAHQIVRDGEGASKFISITVTGAENDGAARRIGLAIANSPLVKTAIAGEDANWGRIVMAVGKSGEKADRDKLKVRIGGVLITSKGGIHPGYDEHEAGAAHEGPEHRHRDGCGHRQGPGDGVDLRSDPCLH
jgi:glutamate N-acetyltransferase/amino-acid N-acetyltransferase